MAYLILGLVLFLGVHSVRIVAEGWRQRMRQRLGEGAWKGVYSLLALAGLLLMVLGFAQVREQPVLLWLPPQGMRHLAALLTAVAFVLFAAAYVPGNGIKARVHHPMVAGVKLWALAHLLSNGMAVHLLVFGSFLLWAVACFAAARRRDRAEGTVYPPGRPAATVVTVLLGLLAWASVVFWLHGMLVGIRPLG